MTRLASLALVIGISCAPASKPALRDVGVLGRSELFARYVVAMHRSIHQQFARGRRSGSGEAVLRIGVRPDGTLARLELLRPSGIAALDVAAHDSVQRAAPFPPTPPEIRSADGNVWLDWPFYADERACDVAGVEPHVYVNDQPPASEKALE